MSDLISRQAAIDLLKQMRKDGDMIPWEGKDVFARIRKLPSAQPERKKGKWIEQDAGGDGVFYECSVCQEGFVLIDGTPSDNLYNFCPNCGCCMGEGDSDDER